MNYVPPNTDGYYTQPNAGAYATHNGGVARSFSTFSADSIANNMSSNMFATEDISMVGYEDSHEQGDPKRRRIARACDMCRKKKIKCDGKMPACSHCQNYKTECIFTQVEKKRAPPKGAKYIEGLENRLGRMEALLRLSGLLNDDDDAGTDLQTLEQRLAEKNAQMAKENDSSNGTERTRESSAEAATTPQASTTVESSSAAEPLPQTSTQNGTKPKSRKDQEVEALSEAMCSLVTNNCGDTRYIGSASGFSIFSNKGIGWINEKTGDTSFQDMVAGATLEDNKLVQWRQDVFGDIFQRRVYKPLPSKAEAMSLIADFFAHFNCMFPLFLESQFMQLVEKHYAGTPPEGSGWWASLNVALAIAHRLRVMSGVSAAEEDHKAWGYLKNAMAVQTELTMRNTDLLSIQALLGMSMFLMGTPNPQPSFFLVAAAIRLAHSLGLHKKASTFAGLDPNEVEQRKRVFWIAYMLDKDICLRSGRPPIQDDDDMNIELPSDDPPDNIGNIPLADGKGKVNLFRLMCTFAVISSKVYKSLYSVKASRQSDGELLNAIGELDKELEDWKDAIPIDFRPEHEIKASHTPLMLHIVVLHFAYYNCLTTIHRMSVHHGYWTSRLSNYAIQGLNVRPLNPRVFSSAALCVSAARASINLIKYIPRGDFDCVWLILYYPVSAHVTLFANILQNPQDSRARSDLKLMNQVVEFLSMLCADENNTGVRRMRDICGEFERISRVVLDKSDRESSSRRKRKQTDTESPAAALVNPVFLGQNGQMPTGDIPKVWSPPSGSQTVQFDGKTPPPSLFPQPQPFLSPRHSVSPLGGASPISNPASLGTSPAAFNFNVPLNSTMSMNGLVPGVAGMQAPGGNAADPFAMTGLQDSPFVPQDLWQMPMALEWDWEKMTSQF